MATIRTDLLSNTRALLIFVLARIFETGSCMRSELQETI
jgi:hypothetical protein